MALCAGLWVIARGTGVAVVEQFAVVAMLSALALAVLGLPATRVLAFPLAFLFFMVPFGRAIVPWLMQATADMATLALQIERHSGSSLAHLSDHSGGQLRGRAGLQWRRLPDDGVRARCSVRSPELQ